MNHITIVDNEYITIEYIPEKKLIYHTIHQPVNGPKLRDALNLGTEALGKYGATKWLSDDRKNGPLPPEDIEWGFNDWNRRTAKLGWKYWAIVVPQEIAAADSLSPVIDDLYEVGLRMMVFTNLEEAFAWLDKME